MSRQQKTKQVERQTWISKFIGREPVRESIEGVSANPQVTKARMSLSKLITFDHFDEIGGRRSDLMRRLGTKFEDIQERSLPLKIHTLIIQEIELLLLILKADLDPHLHLIPSSLSDPDPDLQDQREPESTRRRRNQ